MHSGRCYCGAVTLTITAEPETVTYCHCADCRRVTGAPVAAFVAFPVAGVAVSPDPGEVSAVVGVSRRFCRICGSPLTATFDYLPGQIYVPLGVLDNPEAFPPEMHAHAERCLPWLKIDYALPRSEGSARDDLNAAGNR
ncbi:MAG: GFA family protein [Pseudomonadota bacterium]